jgi:hypothetical protein
MNEDQVVRTREGRGAAWFCSVRALKRAVYAHQTLSLMLHMLMPVEGSSATIGTYGRL